jgi:hypothetical protein
MPGIARRNVEWPRTAASSDRAPGLVRVNRSMGYQLSTVQSRLATVRSLHHVHHDRVAP